MIDQKGLISSDMLDDKQVEQYIKWAEELGITYTIEIKEGLKLGDKVRGPRIIKTEEDEKK